ncbi:MAG: di-heme-cytochrome C peroxidase [Pikeienuella sp.]
MRRCHALAVAVLMVFFSAVCVSAGPVVYADQGKKWTDDRRLGFYSQDQGARIMPISWFNALKQGNGDPFVGNSLQRYGYLANDKNPTKGLPVGFTTNDYGGETAVGMTCAACHTRQITVDGTAYRLDGGPAIVDFQGFLADLDQSVLNVLASSKAFDDFADSVLGSGTSETDKKELKIALDVWSLRFHTLIERSLPSDGWGPGRLDAVSMIFNRLAGLDIGKPPSYLIPDNIDIADAPTRYPFLWNASRQDFTQWPGFAANGDDLLALARNLGEVYGVFGEFHPTKQSGILKLDRDYISNNSANFSGLHDLEDYIKKIGPPKWPWALDTAKAKLGKAIYNRSTEEGGCTDCHGIRKGAFRSIFHKTWKTTIVDTGTDTRECGVLARTVDTGILSGASIPLTGKTLKPTDTAFNTLTVSVLGAIIQNALPITAKENAAVRSPDDLPSQMQHLSLAFNPIPLDEGLKRTASPEAQGTCKYEGRVLQGIWATAPYLHNGSVKSLADLLKPAAERAASFKLGPNYDIEEVGLAAEQTMFDYTLKTTDCSAPNSGNSRCGHEFGTSLSATEKDQLLEYLKSL